MSRYFLKTFFSFYHRENNIYCLDLQMARSLSNFFGWELLLCRKSEWFLDYVSEKYQYDFCWLKCNLSLYPIQASLCASQLWNSYIVCPKRYIHIYIYIWLTKINRLPAFIFAYSQKYLATVLGISTISIIGVHPNTASGSLPSNWPPINTWNFLSEICTIFIAYLQII